MEAYTTMKMTVNGNVNTKDLVAVIRESLKNSATDEYEEISVNRFCDDIKTKKNQMYTESSCTLAPYEFDYLKDALIAVAKETDCEFTFEANHEHCNCGYEAYIDAEYKEGILTYKEFASESMAGCCSDEDCGEWIVHALDYDPSKTYVCPECGRELTGEEMFPYGVPTWEVEEIKIK